MSSGETHFNESTKKASRGSNGQKVDEIAAYLKKRHPELFQVSPRAGGFQRTVAPSFPDDSRIAVASEKDPNVPKAKSTMQSIATSTPRSSSANIKEILITNLRCPRMLRTTKSEEDKDSMVRIISIVVSTVMMLARRSYKGITAQHVRHAEEYFRSLKEEDDYPQNIGQLLQLLSNLKEAGKIPSTSENEEEEDFDDEMTF